MGCVPIKKHAAIFIPAKIPPAFERLIPLRVLPDEL